jgi:periplasmic protein TonB
VFEMLIESKKSAAYGGAFGGGAFSITLHAVIISAAVYATMHAKEVVREVRHQIDVTLQTQEKKEEPPPPKQELASVVAPPKGFQTLSMPTNIPINIPPPSANTNFNAADFSGVGVEGGVARGITTGPVVRTDQPYLESVVEERPERISGPLPRYPDILKQAGIDGHVVIEAIIDTTGHAERASIKILSTTNALFEQPSREFMAASVFRPGKISGRAVRVRIQQPLNYSVTKGGLGGP